MGKHITIIDGHPDSDPARFCHALAAVYRDGALGAGHEVRTIAIADAPFPPLRTRKEWETPRAPDELASAQDAIAWADHVVIIYPLWLGTMPALLKGFLEQVLRPGFAISFGGNPMKSGLLKGKSARVVVTMGMPAFVYRWFFGAHSLKSLERNILKFCGFGPIRETLFGGIESGEAERRGDLEKMRALGAGGA